MTIGAFALITLVKLSISFVAVSDEKSKLQMMRNNS